MSDTNPDSEPIDYERVLAIFTKKMDTLNRQFVIHRHDTAKFLDEITEKVAQLEKRRKYRIDTAVNASRPHVNTLARIIELLEEQPNYTAHVRWLRNDQLVSANALPDAIEAGVRSGKLVRGRHKIRKPGRPPEVLALADKPRLMNAYGAKIVWEKQPADSDPVVDSVTAEATALSDIERVYLVAPVRPTGITFAATVSDILMNDMVGFPDHQDQRLVVWNPSVDPDSGQVTVPWEGSDDDIYPPETPCTITRETKT